MKFLIGVVSMAFSFSAVAGMYPIFEKQKVRLIIERSELTFKDNQFDIKVDRMCTLESVIDVLDMRSSNGEGIQNALKVCEFESHGRKISVSLYPFSTVEKSSEFGDIKNYYSFPYVQAEEGLPVPQIPSATASTRELGVKDMILTSKADQYLLCLEPGGKKTVSKYGNLLPTPPDSKCEVINPIAYNVKAHFETLK